MLVTEQTKGYVILRHPIRLVHEYEESRTAVANEQFLSRLREAVSALDPTLYRGIARSPLSPWSSEENTLKQNNLAVGLREIRARKKFQEIVGEDRDLWDYDPNKRNMCKEMLTELSEAQEIYQHLEAKQEYEIVQLARREYLTNWCPLGYDIGQWAGDHFSIICDSVIMPEWHPPIPDDLAELSEKVRSLNRYGLFSSTEEALEFKEYYLSKQWAETESFSGEFCVIQVSIEA